MIPSTATDLNFNWVFSKTAQKAVTAKASCDHFLPCLLTHESSETSWDSMTHHLWKCLLTGHNFLSCFISWPINLHLDFCLSYKTPNRRSHSSFYNYIFCKLLDATEVGSGRDPNSQPSDLWANHQGILPSSAAQFQHSTNHLLLTLEYECQHVNMLTTNPNNKKLW